MIHEQTDFATSEAIRPDASVPPPADWMYLGKPVAFEATSCAATVAHEAKVSLGVMAIDAEVLRVAILGPTGDWPKSTPAIVEDVSSGLPWRLERGDRAAALVSEAGWRVEIDQVDGTWCVAHRDLASKLAGLTWYRAKRGGACTFRSAEDARFYGLGEKPGPLDKRNEAYTMWNSDVYAPHVPEMEALYLSVPFVIRLEQQQVIGIFVDNPGRSRFDFRSRHPDVEIATERGGLDVYFIFARSLKDAIRRYTALTGRMPLPPRWALGYHQSRYSYETQSEVVSVAQTFRHRDIPLDALYLDIHYMDGFRVFTFDDRRFPDPAGMCRELQSLGVHVVPIVDPGVKQDPEYPVYREGLAQDRFCKTAEGQVYLGEVWPGMSAFPDFFAPAVRTWWGDWHRVFTHAGIEGIWNDMNEPAVFNETKTMDVGVLHRDGDEMRTHGEVHNLYGFWMAAATYEGLKEQLQGRRPFVLTRAGYSGIQRYAAVWTGDNRSFWEHMAMAIPMVLNMGMSGIAFGGPDVGGFAHHASGELLARWTQMGAFFPFFRNHSAMGTHRQEPWSFGPKFEAIIRQAIRRRYRFLPYLYTLFREAHETGLPVMRPLVLEYPDDPATYNLDDEFLVGTDLLVAPVLKPDFTCRAVYLPEGEWIDYDTHARYRGGQHVLVEAPLERIPVFVRAGSAIPVNLAEVPGETKLAWEIYLGADGQAIGRLYQDDGETFAYEDGAYCDRQLRAVDTGDGICVECTLVYGSGEGGSTESEIRILTADGAEKRASAEGISFAVKVR
ncbi:glycoside hydrolase family 31 protein [Alicyclobacillus vulcanalis]|uniref:Alpha-glucosidase n=1 Tax=Alicyclobacillus vulcanalis TaxID=252246 RepID=A0A1N7LK13_9BACL|nr:TIM-barrel domain-containing protein [Alicyclobacillus vulcanalis]SIS74129.1 alpha-glucosidase [Alicyclobacillus vulcanalis]